MPTGPLNDSHDPPMNLTTYEAWRECIEVRCGIPLTQEFVDARLAELRDPDHPKTREFTKLYGTKHLDRTIAWFKRAQGELSTP